MIVPLINRYRDNINKCDSYALLSHRQRARKSGFRTNPGMRYARQIELINNYILFIYIYINLKVCVFLQVFI